MNLKVAATSDTITFNSTNFDGPTLSFGTATTLGLFSIVNFGDAKLYVMGAVD